MKNDYAHWSGVVMSDEVTNKPAMQAASSLDMSGTVPPSAIVLIDADPDRAQAHAAALRAAGHPVVVFDTTTEARAHMARHAPRIVVLNLRADDAAPRALFADIRAGWPDARIIVTAARDAQPQAIDAMRAGAGDFLIEPFAPALLVRVLHRALVGQKADITSGPIGKLINPSIIVGAAYEPARVIANSTGSVFLTGECATGKETCAELIHTLSPHADGPFVTLDLSTLTPEFIRNELDSRPGSPPPLLCRADGGTLFLKEIAALDPALQGMLLRALHSAASAGGIRVITAMSRDPQSAIRAGQLRADLYYHLNVLPLHLPPLRARKSDLGDMADSMLVRLALREGKAIPHLAPDLRDTLRQHDWPGNIRQLLNVLWHMVVMSDAPVLDRSALQPDFSAPANVDTAISYDDAIRRLRGHDLGRIERHLIEQTIAAENGSVPLAARQLGVAPSTLYRKISAWGGAKPA